MEISKNNKKFLGGLLFVFLVAVIVSVNHINLFDQKVERGVGAHKNQIDQRLSLNLERNITQNAIISNPKFSGITFESSQSDKKSLFKDQLANVYRIVTSIRSPFEQHKEYGVWLWTPTLQIKPDYTQSVLATAKKNGVNVIYVSIDSYLDIYSMEEGELKKEKHNEFVAILEDFIKEANSMGIEVDAEAGWQNWAEPGHAYKPVAIVEFVKNFNQTQKYNFRGFQYDVEPYLLDVYQKDDAKVLKNFVTLIDQTVKMLEGSDLKLGVVIPDFYDEKDGSTSRFSYNNEDGYAFKHLLNVLEKRVGSSIILMSYRNYALGEDGSIEISMNEIQTVEEGFYKTKIIVAQEVGEVLPPYITFHNTSQQSLIKEVALIHGSLKIYPNFGGVAYHYVNSLAKLK